MSKRITSYFSLARNVASKSNQRHRHGAVLLRGGSVINMGFNNKGYNQLADKYSSYRRNGNISPGTRHAEIDACNLENSQTKNGIIIVCRINLQGFFRPSLPCPMCIKVMLEKGIKRVYYSLFTQNKDLKYGQINL